MSVTHTQACPERRTRRCNISYYVPAVDVETLGYQKENHTVQTHRHTPAPAADDFAASMRIDVKQADGSRALPVLRVDRHGLTIAVIDDSDLPPIGLPRRALISCDSTALCELRLVSRSVARTQGRGIEMTMQPSRADDHAVLWLALRAHQLHHGRVPGGVAPPWSVHGEPAQAAKPTAHTAYTSPAADAQSAAAASELAAEPSTDGIGATRMLVWCDTAFTMANRDDAWFFSHWLEYHFAEVRARTRMSYPAADLRDMHTRIVDHEVEVRFLFQSSERIVQACAEASCRWIAAEAARQVGMAVEHWLCGASSAGDARLGWPRHATVASGATRHP